MIQFVPLLIPVLASSILRLTMGVMGIYLGGFTGGIMSDQIRHNSKEDKKIMIFVTGGTFDKEYNEITGELVFKDTHLPEMLSLGRCKLDVEIRTLMMIDSLYMKDSDREIILQNCLTIPNRKILITHGTDTMEVTARYLGKKIKNKTIVLTGAMIPYRFGSSDGMFNLGSSLAFVQILPPGVYISMNGKYFHYDNVRKNKKLGIFEEIS